MDDTIVDRMVAYQKGCREGHHFPWTHTRESATHRRHKSLQEHRDGGDEGGWGAWAHYETPTAPVRFHWKHIWWPRPSLCQEFPCKLSQTRLLQCKTGRWSCRWPSPALAVRIYVALPALSMDHLYLITSNPKFIRMEKPTTEVDVLSNPKSLHGTFYLHTFFRIADTWQGFSFWKSKRSHRLRRWSLPSLLQPLLQRPRSEASIATLRVALHIKKMHQLNTICYDHRLWNIFHAKIARTVSANAFCDVSDELRRWTRCALACGSASKHQMIKRFGSFKVTRLIVSQMLRWHYLGFLVSPQRTLGNCMSDYSFWGCFELHLEVNWWLHFHPSHCCNNCCSKICQHIR